MVHSAWDVRRTERPIRHSPFAIGQPCECYVIPCVGIVLTTLHLSTSLAHELMMLLLNYSHPLTDDQLDAIRRLTGDAQIEVRDIASHVDLQRPLAAQVVALAEAAALSPRQWQTAPILVNAPALNYSAVALLAELHGRMGYFPPVLRLRPVADALPPRYEVAEILNLQALRNEARTRR